MFHVRHWWIQQPLHAVHPSGERLPSARVMVPAADPTSRVDGLSLRSPWEEWPGQRVIRREESVVLVGSCWKLVVMSWSRG